MGVIYLRLKFRVHIVVVYAVYFASKYVPSRKQKSVQDYFRLCTKSQYKNALNEKKVKHLLALTLLEIELSVDRLQYCTGRLQYRQSSGQRVFSTDRLQDRQTSVETDFRTDRLQYGHSSVKTDFSRDRLQSHFRTDSRQYRQPAEQTDFGAERLQFSQQ